MRKRILMVALICLSLVLFAACSFGSSKKRETDAPETYSFTFEADGAQGSVTAKLSTGGQSVQSGATLEEGTGVTLTATPKTGYSFAGWYKGNTKASDANPYTFSVSEAVAVRARFTANEYAVTYVSEDVNRGSVTGTAASGTKVAYGTSVTLTASAKAGYTFAGWYKGNTKASDANPYTFTQGCTSRGASGAL